MEKQIEMEEKRKKMEQELEEKQKKLEEEKEKSAKRSQQEAEEMLKRLKRSQELEIEELKNELVYSKQRFDIEVQEKTAVTQRQSSKLQDLKDRLYKEFDQEKLFIEKETERQRQWM